MRAFKSAHSRIDLRAHAREAANRPDKVLDGPYVVDATLKDISPAGARLAFAARVPGADSLMLVDTAVATAHACRVVWRKGGECGVQFTKSQDLRGLVAGPFDAAKRLWLASRR
jgi:hypothetical protein